MYNIFFHLVFSYLKNARNTSVYYNSATVAYLFKTLFLKAYINSFFFSNVVLSIFFFFFLSSACVSGWNICMRKWVEKVCCIRNGTADKIKWIVVLWYFKWCFIKKKKNVWVWNICSIILVKNLAWNWSTEF